MDLFTREDLNALIDENDYPCISIYMPAVVKGREVRKNPILFKNLVEEAEKEASREKYPQLYETAHRLQEDTFFWGHQEKGMAAFLSPGIFKYYRLPVEFPQEVVVTDRFHVKPLLEMFMETGEFYILAFSANQVRFFRGTRFSVDEINIESMPKDMGTALRFDVPQKSIEFHTRTSPSKGGAQRPAVFHGQGVAGDKREHKKNILRYLHKIDDALKGFLRDSKAPLVLAGVEYLLPLYREANSYNFLLEEGIKGNPERIKPEQLHREAWNIVEPHFKQKRLEDTEKFQMMAGKESPLASTDHKTIVQQAYRGKVGTLFVAVGRHKWGRYDPEHDSFRLDSPKKNDSEDLLELAAIYAIRHGGKVYALEAGEMPAHCDVAGILRK
ncbi:MAG: hypothetical protein GF409_07735 [Candidatus Omnitrophica bacterium]|nr:hypothetical protein [Candidatus Omnitrophota bacterium]